MAVSTWGRHTISGIPVVSYAEFWDEFWWEQSKHITIIGTTGCGKTTLELDLITEREYVIFLGTKEIDDTQAELGPLGFRIARDPREISLDISSRWVLHPGQIKIRGETATEMKRRLQGFYQEALDYCFAQTAWAVVIDEGRFICQFLGLKDEVSLLYLQGRSQHNSVVMGTQRPAWVALEAFDAATHLFFFRDNDLKNIQRIAELAGLDKKAVQTAVPQLESTENEGGQFLYYNTRSDAMMISKVEL
jgi:hypothetical protein